MTNRVLAPARFACTALSPSAEPPSGVSSASPLRSTGAQSLVPLRHEMAKRNLARWFEAEWQKLLADKAAKEREIERKFWAGEYRG